MSGITYRSVKGSKLTSDEVDHNFQYLENLVGGSGNSITTQTGFSLAGQDLTINAGWQWKILTVPYTNASSVLINIPLAAAGNERIDLIVANQSNTFERIAGIESASNASAPAVPANKIFITFVTVTDGEVESPVDPVTGSQFKQKNESQKITQVLGGTNAVIDLRTFGQQYYSVVGPVTSVAGFSKALLTATPTAEVPYNGKDFFFENKTDHDVTLKDNFSGVDVKFNLDADLVVPSNGIVWLKYDAATETLSLFFKSWSEVDLSTKLDKVSTVDVEKVYIKKADGSQGMKPVSEFLIGKEYTFNTNVSQSFGDSITVGQNSTGDNSYIKLITALYGTTNTNRAVAGRGIWEAVRLHNANVNPATGAFSVVMAGFNDVRRGGNAVKTFSKIENGYRGIIVNQFMRTSIAGNTVSASLTRSGSWSQFFADTVGGKYNNGAFSSTSGNYIEYAFSDNNVTVGMIGGDGVSQIYGNFDVHIDGVLQGSYSVNNKTDGISDGSNNNQRSPYILFFTGLADGNHTIRITLTNSLPVPVDYFGHLKDPNLCTPILLMEAPKMNATGYAIAPANATDAIIDELNILINSVANEFSSEFPIIVAKTNDYYDVTTGLDTDNIHPNNLGHRQIYQSAYEALREVILVQIPSSTNLLLSNNSWTGTNDYTQRVKTSSGFQAQGALVTPTGVGVEIEYNSSEGFVTSYNRSSSSWVNLNIRGAILKFLSGGTQRMEVNTNGLKLNTLPTYADDASAGAGGLTAGQLYKTATGELRVKL